MPNGTPVLATLHKILQQGLQRCLSSHGAGESSQRSSFHHHIRAGQEPQQTCHEAFELHEVLVQVFLHLDSRTLCTSVPLVCQHWRQTSACEQIWAPRCDPQLLAAVQQPCSHVLPDDAAAGDACKTSPAACADMSPSIQPIAAAPGPSYSVQLPLLHFAVYSCNLLRNPTFLAAANADYSATLQRLRLSSGNRPPTVLTAEQRKFAWVTTVGEPQWEQAAQTSRASSAAAAAGFQPPVPLRCPSSPTPCTSLHSQLQGWLFGKPSSSGGGTSIASLTAILANTGSSVGASVENEAVLSNGSAGVSYLSTGSNWAEVVQVIDVLAELAARGLDPDTAAAVLDDASLAIGLSFWVAGTPDAVDAAPCPGGLVQASTGKSCNTDSSSSNGSGSGGGGSSGGNRSGSSADGGRAARQQSPAQFAAALMLDGGQVPLRSFQTFVRNDSSHHFFSKRLAVDPADGWRRYSYVVPCCPKGLRRAVVLMRGRGTGPGSSAAAAEAAAAAAAAGGSGSTGGVRFACAQLSFLRACDVEAFGAEECLDGWRDRVVHGF